MVEDVGTCYLLDLLVPKDPASLSMLIHSLRLWHRLKIERRIVSWRMRRQLWFFTNQPKKWTARYGTRIDPWKLPVGPRVLMYNVGTFPSSNQKKQEPSIYFHSLRLSIRRRPFSLIFVGQSGSFRSLPIQISKFFQLVFIFSPILIDFDLQC